MAQNTKPAAKKDEEPARNSDKKTIILIGIIAILALIIAAGGGWFFANQKKNTPQVEEVKIEPPKTPIFIVLDPFTVNLQRESSDQYLQIGITLKVFEDDIEKSVKTNLPEIRSKILQVLTTKTATELLTADGKQQLANEIVSVGNTVIGISNEPSPSPDAASQVAPATVVPSNTQVARAGAASAPATEDIKQTELKGIIDVLFTSFIIQ